MLIIVTGLGRSGTSLMMQCLQKAGINVLHDKTYEAHLKKMRSDAHQYMEHPNPSQAAEQWLTENSDKLVAVKCVQIPLSMTPIAQQYEVFTIVMTRSKKSWEASWRNTFYGDPPIERQKQIDQLVAVSKNSLQIPYNELVDEPKKWLTKIAKFIPLDINKACKAVKPELRHYK